MLLPFAGLRAFECGLPVGGELEYVDAGTIGALFDRFPDSVILDQRLLWIFPLAYLVVKGAGAGADVTASGVFADIMRATLQ